MAGKFQGSNKQEFPSLETGIAWLTMQGNDHPRFYMIAAMKRAGISSVFAILMAGLYPSASGDGHFFLAEWEENPFVVLSFPEKERTTLETFLRGFATPFRLAKGEPTRLTSANTSAHTVLVVTHRKGDPEQEQTLRQLKYTAVNSFPLTGENVFVIEEYREKRGPFVSMSHFFRTSGGKP